MKVSIIGTGNVAYHFYKAFLDEGVNVEKIISRDPENLRAELKAKGGSYEDIPSLESEVILLAVRDDAIPEVLTDYNFPHDAVLAHTSGATSMEVFEGTIESYGVFYPLQTIKKEKEINYQELPIFIEGNSEKSRSALKELANIISGKVGEMTSRQRLAAHTAAVFASNFTNHMLHISEELLQKNGLDKELLYPLIRETTSKALDQGAGTAQTGPAIRNDKETMSRHLEVLEVELQKELYKKISKSIQNSMK